MKYESALSSENVDKRVKKKSKNCFLVKYERSIQVKKSRQFLAYRWFNKTSGLVQFEFLEVLNASVAHQFVAFWHGWTDARTARTSLREKLTLSRRSQNDGGIFTHLHPQCLIVKSLEMCLLISWNLNVFAGSSFVLCGACHCSERIQCSSDENFIVGLG